jgi:phospholipid-binding lipoprotein MlaA
MINKISVQILIIFCILSNSVFAKNYKKQNYNLSTTNSQDDFELDSYQSSTTVKIQDPYEKINRKIFYFNEKFDQYFFEHIAKAYRTTIPNDGRKIIRNFLSNLSLPISAVNSIAQGKIDNGLSTFSTFLINSTIGFAGFFNVASKKGITYNFEDLGQTLGTYNIDQGSFIIIPILGPSTTRDFSGMVIDKAIGPLNFNILEFGGTHDLVDNRFMIYTTSLNAIDTRESLINIIDDIRQDSFDPYATIRFAYLQKRAREIQK